MTFLKKYGFHGFILFVYLLVYVFLNNPNTGFFSDDYVWLSRYQKLGFNGLLNNYNDQFFLPLTYLTQLIEWICFKENYLLYFFVNSLVFVSTLFVLYELLKHLKTELELPNYWSEIIVSMVVLSPYNTEVIKWYSSQSYLFSTFFIIIAFSLYVKYKKSNQNVYLILLLSSFFISILFKEISLFFPFSILFLEVILFRKKTSAFLLVSIFSVLILYFVLRLIFLGDLIGGYGIETHLNFSFHKIIIGIAAYFAKFFFLYRYEVGFYFMLVLNVLLFLILIAKRNKLMLFFTGCLVLLLLLSLIPVINLEISFLDSIQSDRYGYLPGIFASILLGSTITFLFDKKSALAVSFALVLVQFYLLDKTLYDWTKAQEFRDNFIHSIQEKSMHNSSIIVLNLPDNYNGIYIFRNGFENFQNKYLPTFKIDIGVLYQSKYNDVVKSSFKNSSLFISTNSGNFFPYIRSSFKPLSLKSDEGVFSVKSAITPIFLFNGNKLEQVNLLKK